MPRFTCSDQELVVTTEKILIGIFLL